MVQGSLVLVESIIGHSPVIFFPTVDGHCVIGELFHGNGLLNGFPCSS
jgi:hypothetical protein